MTAFLPLLYDAKLTQSEFYMITKPHSTLHICTPVLISLLSVCKVYKTTFQHTVPMKLDFIHIFAIESKCRPCKCNQAYLTVFVNNL